jgi:hypothetical protein
MNSEKAVLMYCPFVARKCQGEKCLAWSHVIDKKEGCGDCILLMRRVMEEAMPVTMDTNTPNP